MSHSNGFLPVAGREELRSAMRNRFYDNVSRPGHYGFVHHDVVTADMTPLGRGRRPRGVRGLGDLCDDRGAAMGVGIFAAIANVGGSLLSSSGRATVGDDGAKTGGDRGRADAGGLVSGAGDAVVDAWTAACLSSTRGAATGASPTESMDSVLARARAEAVAAANAERIAELEEDRERADTERSNFNRNLLIGGGVVVAVGAAAFFFTR